MSSSTSLDPAHRARALGLISDAPPAPSSVRRGLDLFGRCAPIAAWIIGLLLSAAVAKADSGVGAYGLTVAAQLEQPGLRATLSASPPYRCVTDRYVDVVRGDDANPGTADAPWRTISNADNGWPHRTVAGECVNVAPGTYVLAKPLIIAHGGSSNTPDGYVVYRSTVPQAAHLVATPELGSAGNGDMIMIWAPYVIVDGFEVDGGGLTSGHAIDGCTGGGQPMNIAHHFQALNNVIHDVGGSGLSSCSADFVSWQHNVVYRTSGSNRYQTSGINLWMPKGLAASNEEAAPGDMVQYGITIAYNVSHDNGEGPSIPNDHTDGNGIIIDTTVGSAVCPTCGQPYPGHILVLGNVSYNNGGSGIHVFLSKDVAVLNNTAWNNYLDSRNPGTARGNLSSGGSEGILWMNNIAISLPGGAGSLANNRPIASYDVGAFRNTGVWTRNIAYGGSVLSGHESYVDPHVNHVGINPGLRDPLHGDFVPLAGSIAVDGGVSPPSIPLSRVNIGAY